MPALGFVGGAFAFVLGCGGKKGNTAVEQPTPGGEQPPAGGEQPPAKAEPAAKMTDEEWNAERDELLKHYKVVNEPEPKSRSRGMAGPEGFDTEGVSRSADSGRCIDTDQGHIDHCEGQLSGCQDSVLCDSALTGGCNTANFCKLSNYGECPNKVVCKGDVASK